jgi:hypothetical protein
MPNHKTHCAISKQRTGYAFDELHHWIDSPSKKLGSDHRLERHAYNKRDKETISNYWKRKKGKGWGNKAIVEWLFHIGLDNMSTAFKFSKSGYGKNAYNFLELGIQDSGYIHAAFDRLNKKDLEKRFSKARPTLLDGVGQFTKGISNFWKSITD